MSTESASESASERRLKRDPIRQGAGLLRSARGDQPDCPAIVERDERYQKDGEVRAESEDSADLRFARYAMRLASSRPSNVSTRQSAPL